MFPSSSDTFKLALHAFRHRSGEQTLIERVIEGMKYPRAEAFVLIKISELAADVKFEVPGGILGSMVNDGKAAFFNLVLRNIRQYPECFAPEHLDDLRSLSTLDPKIAPALEALFFIQHRSRQIARRVGSLPIPFEVEDRKITWAQIEGKFLSQWNKALGKNDPEIIDRLMDVAMVILEKDLVVSDQSKAITASIISDDKHFGIDHWRDLPCFGPMNGLLDQLEAGTSSLNLAGKKALTRFFAFKTKHARRCSTSVAYQIIKSGKADLETQRIAVDGIIEAGVFSESVKAQINRFRAVASPEHEARVYQLVARYDEQRKDRSRPYWFTWLQVFSEDQEHSLAYVTRLEAYLNAPKNFKPRPNSFIDAAIAIQHLAFSDDHMQAWYIGMDLAIEYLHAQHMKRDEWLKVMERGIFYRYGTTPTKRSQLVESLAAAFQAGDALEPILAEAEMDRYVDVEDAKKYFAVAQGQLSFEGAVRVWFPAYSEELVGQIVAFISGPFDDLHTQKFLTRNDFNARFAPIASQVPGDDEFDTYSRLTKFLGWFANRSGKFYENDFMHYHETTFKCGAFEYTRGHDPFNGYGSSTIIHPLHDLLGDISAEDEQLFLKQLAAVGFAHARLLHHETLAKAKLPPFFERQDPWMRQALTFLLLELELGTQEQVRTEFSAAETEDDELDTLKRFLRFLNLEKIAQIAASRRGLLPPKYEAAFESFYDTAAKPSSYSTIAEQLLKELKIENLDEVFQVVDGVAFEIMRNDAGQALVGSIGEIYRACLKDGTPVVLKVVTDQKKEKMTKNMDVLERVALVMDHMAEEHGVHISLRVLAKQFRAMIEREMKFLGELGNANAYKAAHPSDNTPKYFMDYCTDSLLIMSELSAARLVDSARDDDDSRVKAGVFGSRVVRDVFESVAHGEPHPGNVFEDNAWLDFGALVKLAATQADHLKSFFRSVVTFDLENIIKHFVGLCDEHYGNDRNAMTTALNGAITSGMLPQRIPDWLLNHCKDYGFTVRQDYMDAFRSLQTADKTGRMLDPNFQIVDHVFRLIG